MGSKTSDPGPKRCLKLRHIRRCISTCVKSLYHWCCRKAPALHHKLLRSVRTLIVLVPALSLLGTYLYYDLAEPDPPAVLSDQFWIVQEPPARTCFFTELLGVGGAASTSASRFEQIAARTTWLAAAKLSVVLNSFAVLAAVVGCLWFSFEERRHSRSTTGSYVRFDLMFLLLFLPLLLFGILESFRFEWKRLVRVLWTGRIETSFWDPLVWELLVETGRLAPTAHHYAVADPLQGLNTTFTGLLLSLTLFPAVRLEARRVVPRLRRSLFWQQLILYLSAISLAAVVVQNNYLWRIPALWATGDTADAIRSLAVQNASSLGVFLSALILAAFVPAHAILQWRIRTLARRCSSRDESPEKWMQRHELSSTTTQQISWFLAALAPALAGGPFGALVIG